MKSSAEQGVALVAVLLVMAVVVAVIADMALSHRAIIAQTANTLNGRQAWHYAIGAETLAKQMLGNDWEDRATRDQDNLNELWARSAGGFETDFGTVEMRIRDVERQFNVNNLITASGSESPPHLDQLERLLDQLALDGRIAGDLVDWIDANRDAHNGGDEESLYAGKSYLPANAKMVDTSELRLLADIRREDAESLLPHLSIAPAGTRTNINTASRMQLLTLIKDATASDVDSILVEQERSGYGSVQDFLDTPEGAAFQPVAANLTVRSDFFEVLARVNYDTSYIVLQSLLHRDPGDGEITVIQRQIWPADALNQEF